MKTAEEITQALHQDIYNHLDKAQAIAQLQNLNEGELAELWQHLVKAEGLAEFWAGIVPREELKDAVERLDDVRTQAEFIKIIAKGHLAEDHTEQ